MQKKIYTIQDLREGKVALVYSPYGKGARTTRLPQLLNVLKAAFPNHPNIEQDVKDELHMHLLSRSKSDGYFGRHFLQERFIGFQYNITDSKFHLGTEKWDEKTIKELPIQSVMDFPLDNNKK